MTNLPGSCLLASLARKNVTAGFNVPADSHVPPCGEKMGSLEARVHAPKRRSAGGAATASHAAQSSNEMENLVSTSCRVGDSPLRCPGLPAWARCPHSE